jgi:rare lipoprotein A
LLLLLAGCAGAAPPPAQVAAPLPASKSLVTTRPQPAPPAGAKLAALPEAGLPDAAPEPAISESYTGIASWYGTKFHGRITASGEPYDMAALTAAHQSLPFGSRVRVTNLANGRSVVVVINDRGPYAKDRLIDLSHAAARRLGILEDGLAEVRIDVLADAAS